ncbi:MAG: carboxypeptidase regulatory-like domain-containing protein, partial [Bryobacteraceae bacterium]|nr:carboxypeptidase regulatory-like domain-containing protein [Bryobacteraceae bacterium]
LIIDPSGAPVPNVTVEIRNQGTNELRRVASNQVGMYEVPNLVPGLYTVKAQAQGFRSIENRDLHLEALRTLRVDFKLEVGSVETAVTVIGGAPVVETETATIYSVRTMRQLQEMPLNL